MSWVMVNNACCFVSLFRALTVITLLCNMYVWEADTWFCCIDLVDSQEFYLEKRSIETFKGEIITRRYYVLSDNTLLLKFYKLHKIANEEIGESLNYTKDRI